MKKTILIVDDIALNRELFHDFLDEDYNCLDASNGLEALSIINDTTLKIDAVLLDLMMPELDGLETLRALSQNQVTEMIPIIIHTSERSEESTQLCFSLGAYDCIHAPFEGILLKKRINNALMHFTYQKGMERILDKQNEELLELNFIRENSRDSILKTLKTIMSNRDPYYESHAANIKEFVRIIAFNYRSLYPDCGLTDEYINVISFVSEFHDIGKIMLKDSIIFKTSALKGQELENYRQHTVLGKQIIDGLSIIWPKEMHKVAGNICLYHHECFNGSGYPQNLSGDDIPLCAQLVSIADTLDAILCARSYKDAVPFSQGVNIIESNAGKWFSPQLVNAFTQSKQEIAEYLHILHLNC